MRCVALCRGRSDQKIHSLPTSNLTTTALHTIDQSIHLVVIGACCYVTCLAEPLKSAYPLWPLVWFGKIKGLRWLDVKRSAVCVSHCASSFPTTLGSNFTHLRRSLVSFLYFLPSGSSYTFTSYPCNSTSDTMSRLLNNNTREFTVNRLPLY